MNKRRRKTTGLSYRLIAMLLCCVCLLTVIPISVAASETDDSQIVAENITENTRVPTETVEEIQPEQSEADVLYERIMACATYEEMQEFLGSLSEEEQLLIEQFTEEQNVALTAKMDELGAYAVQTNAEDVNPDANYIMVSKTFVGITADQIPADFQITVNGSSSHTLTLANATAENGLTYSWRIDNVGAGTYTVTESGDKVKNYTLSSAGTGTVTVEAADFTVNYVKETTCNHVDWPVQIDGDKNIMFAAALTNGGCVVVSKNQLTTSQKLTVEKQILAIGGNWKAPVNFYSIDVNGYGPWSIGGKTVEYKPEEGKIYLGATSDWSHVATVDYSITEANNPDIGITNTYIPEVCDLTISKTVNGNMGDRSMEFAFTAVLSGGDYTFDGVTYSIDGGETQSSGTGTTCNFTLKHGQSITFNDLPVGATFTVTETSYDGYVTTVNGESGNSKGITLAETNSRIDFVNTKDVTIDTGVLLDTLPYILILGVVVVGAVLLMRKHRNREDD